MSQQEAFSCSHKEELGVWNQGSWCTQQMAKAKTKWQRVSELLVFSFLFLKVKPLIEQLVQFRERSQEVPEAKRASTAFGTVLKSQPLLTEQLLLFGLRQTHNITKFLQQSALNKLTSHLSFSSWKWVLLEGTSLIKKVGVGAALRSHLGCQIYCQKLSPFSKCQCNIEDTVLSKRKKIIYCFASKGETEVSCPTVCVPRIIRKRRLLQG